MSSFKKVFRHVLNHGRIISPRGQKTLEAENVLCTFEPYERFMAFPSRKLSLDYIRAELLWYLRGDPYDLTICDKAKIWCDMVTHEGKLNSNYGHPVFARNGIDYAVQCLKDDKASRRSIISILAKEHLYQGCKDVPCTVTISFRIRDNSLKTMVHMRSTDLIFGLGNDIPFFSFVSEVALVYLKAAYPDLELGQLTLFSESLHCYERHFKMLPKLVTEEPDEVVCPKLGSVFEIQLLRGGYLSNEDRYPFSRWLHNLDQGKEP